MSPAEWRVLAAAELREGERVCLLGPAAPALAGPVALRVGAAGSVRTGDPARACPESDADVVLALLRGASRDLVGPALREARRRLAPGGRLVLCAPDPPRGEGRELPELIQAAGFEGVEHERLIALSPAGGAAARRVVVARARRARGES